MILFCPIRLEPTLNAVVGLRSASVAPGSASKGRARAFPFACERPNPAPMRRLLPAVLVFLALGPLPGAAMRFQVPDFSQRASAHRLAVAPQTADAMRFVRGWRLTSPNSRFGGFSGLAISAPRSEAHTSELQSLMRI